MGQAHSLTAEIEVNASPEAVQPVFMDFARYKEWSKWTVDIKAADKKPSDLVANDGLKVNLDGMAFSPIVVQNSPGSFQWLGSLPGIFTGKHEFNFVPSNTTPGGTTVVQYENFTGLLAFMMAPGWSFRQKSQANWDRFNADLKKEAEKVAAAATSS